MLDNRLVAWTLMTTIAAITLEERTTLRIGDIGTVQYSRSQTGAQAAAAGFYSSAFHKPLGSRRAPHAPPLNKSMPS